MGRHNNEFSEKDEEEKKTKERGHSRYGGQGEWGKDKELQTTLILRAGETERSLCG